MSLKLKEVLKKILGRKKLLLVLIVVLIVVGFFVRRTFFPSTDGFEEAKIEKGMVREEAVLSGQIKAEEHANLSFLSSGELDLISVTEGQEVKKNDILARLDTTILYQAYMQAEADLRRYDASRDKTYDDVQGHEKDETFAQIENRTIAETNKDKAYRAYVSAQRNLATATLRAPFDGIVSSITYPYTGINTSLTDSQIEIVNPNTLYFEVSADQSEVKDIYKGQKVVIILDAFSDEEFEGVVDFIGLTPKQGELGAVYEVKVKYGNNFYSSISSSGLSKFKIGMTGDAKFILSETGEVLYVPPAFINSDIKGKYLKLGDPNNKTYIETGVENEERVEIKGYVKEGDTVYD